MFFRNTRGFEQIGQIYRRKPGFCFNPKPAFKEPVFFLSRLDLKQVQTPVVDLGVHPAILELVVLPVNGYRVTVFFWLSI